MKFTVNPEEEVICGHTVSTEMKQIWEKQLQMLSKFDEVCRKHNLKYYVSGGTLIGAVRHKGYIPWDDDIDVHMLRRDYNKFSKIAQKELAPFFWQDHNTQDGRKPWHAKIRDSSTTGCTEWERINTPEYYNKGIFIDIFPLDYIWKNRYFHAAHRWIIRHLRVRVGKMTEYGCQHIWRSEANAPAGAEKKFNRRFRLLCRAYSAACRLHFYPSDRVAALTFNCDEKRFVWPAENYRTTVELPFMGATVEAPVLWDDCLKRQFGDYMKIVKNGSMHTQILFDVNVPYSEKLKNYGAQERIVNEE